MCQSEPHRSTRNPSSDASSVSDLRVAGFQPLDAPRQLLEELPLDDRHAATVRTSRDEVRSIVSGDDDRLLVVVGPCSIHDPDAALDYARRLAPVARELDDDLRIVMRVYFEKPRTTVGWKGLINDPGLDGSHDVRRGLRIARELLFDVLDTGLPAGCEFLEPISPQYIADTVSWGAIGARTPESQVHRQLASGLSMPVGVKNATSGDVQAAIDGCIAAAHRHVFFGVDEDGRAAAVSTIGNPDCHVILRGGSAGPNYGPTDVRDALALLHKAELPQRLVIDASHGNSGKDHLRQAVVAREIAEQIAGGETGIAGVMLESFLEAGRQDLDGSSLTYGQSVTDACMDWASTEELLGELAAAVRARRQA
ncbi:3-deoxy-7-phosphoheptulonate synthase [Actinobacteria bacterium YIM 96077]|uniref:Phospho-2-dehydro-3-deoxyheptonate aldolase n=1 Tax=Phytoactinopolyspora halophila TaxID=1981511 RepID=A0A329QRI5_9ACTN|nr:3-deoxy-7-phosphoheptulonate synthase [Phytoactinopolyspora halophila]AYY14214.1 3-deoxy-7-phosphoheptulonate synthase [Actinobacteria bacterium YIM 96077]RAW14756.1 3-deoxy-7-phosphoheptulonate synthase [Phytoactinopolyspora halophila]